MIKFFRKIRYNLMETGKTGKYFKYAIGEIVLVVIGILIALQINNWNEHRLERIEEKAILEAIKVDFKNAIVEFNELNNNRTVLEEASKTIFTIIKSKEIIYTKTELDSILSILLIGPTYNSQTKTLEVLFNSGKMNFISNDSIKDKLVNWSKLVEDMTEGELQGSEVLKDKVIPLLNTYVSFFDLNTKFKFKNYDMFDKTLQSAYSSNYKELFEDRNFENVLSLRELYNKVAIIETNQLIVEAKNIIELINTELKIDD